MLNFYYQICTRDSVLTRRWSGQQNSTNPLLPRSLGFFHGEVAFSDMKDKIRTRGTDRGAKKESGFPNLHPGSFQFLKSLNARQLEGGEARDRGSTKGSASERRLHHATSKKKKKKKTRGAQIHLSTLVPF